MAEVFHEKVEALRTL